MNTENIAHEKRYRDWRAQYDAMFAPENRSPQQDEQFPLTDGYSIRSKAYIYDGDLHLCGSESELLDNEGKVRYAWRNLDTEGEFCFLFRHRSGNHYLIFRTELLWIQRPGGGERTADALCPCPCPPGGGAESRGSVHLDRRGLRPRHRSAGCHRLHLGLPLLHHRAGLFLPTPAPAPGALAGSAAHR